MQNNNKKNLDRRKWICLGKGIVILNKASITFSFSFLKSSWWSEFLAALLQTPWMSLCLLLNNCNPRKETLTEKLALCSILTTLSFLSDLWWEWASQLITEKGLIPARIRPWIKISQKLFTKGNVTFENQSSAYLRLWKAVTGQESKL